MLRLANCELGSGSPCRGGRLITHPGHLERTPHAAIGGGPEGFTHTRPQEVYTKRLPSQRTPAEPLDAKALGGVNSRGRVLEQGVDRRRGSASQFPSPEKVSGLPVGHGWGDLTRFQRSGTRCRSPSAWMTPMTATSVTRWELAPVRRAHSAAYACLRWTNGLYSGGSVGTPSSPRCPCVIQCRFMPRLT